MFGIFGSEPFQQNTVEDDVNVLKSQFNELVGYVRNHRKELNDIKKEMKFLKEQNQKLISYLNSTSEGNLHKVLYPTLYSSFFHNLTVSQLEGLVPKQDRVGTSKDELVVSLFNTLHRKTKEQKHNFDEIYTDRFKFTVATLDSIDKNKTTCQKEWTSFIKTKL